MPSLRDALDSGHTWSRLGLLGSIEPFYISLQGETPEDPIDECDIFATHVRQALSFAKQSFIFSLVPRTFPWAWCRLLSPREDYRNECVEDAKALWLMVLKLEESNHPVHIELLKVLSIRRSVCFREPLNMLQAAGWKVTPELIQYVKALHDNISSSLSLEASGSFAMSLLLLIVFDLLVAHHVYLPLC